MSNFDFVVEPFFPEEQSELFEKIAAVPIQSKLDTDIYIIKKAGMDRGPFGATVAACDYIDRLLDDPAEDLPEVFEKVAAAALDADVASLDDELRYNFEGEALEELQGELRKHAFAIAKGASEVLELIKEAKLRLWKAPSRGLRPKLKKFKGDTTDRSTQYIHRREMSRPDREAHFNRERSKSGIAIGARKAEKEIAGKHGPAAMRHNLTGAKVPVPGKNELKSNVVPARKLQQRKDFKEIDVPFSATNEGAAYRKRLGVKEPGPKASAAPVGKKPETSAADVQKVIDKQRAQDVNKKVGPGHPNYRPPGEKPAFVAGKGSRKGDQRPATEVDAASKASTKKPATKDDLQETMDEAAKKRDAAEKANPEKFRPEAKTEAPPPPKTETPPTPPPRTNTPPASPPRTEAPPPPRQQPSTGGGAPRGAQTTTEGVMGASSKLSDEGWSALSGAEKGRLIAAGVATVGGVRLMSGRDLVSGEKSGGGRRGGNVVVA